MKNFINNYLKEIEETASLLNKDVIQKIIFFLKKTKKNKGRIFFLGVGGGSGNATHAVNDFRKIANFECYSPSDNSSELTARINDDGWDSTYKNWLLTSNISKNDSIFISPSINVHLTIFHQFQYQPNNIYNLGVYQMVVLLNLNPIYPILFQQKDHKYHNPFFLFLFGSNVP